MAQSIRVGTDLHMQANQFAQGADEIRSIYSQIQSESAEWEKANGQSKDLDMFNEKFAETSSLLLKFASALDDQAEMLDKAADMYEQARQRAVSRAGGIGGGLGSVLTSGLSGTVRSMASGFLAGVIPGGNIVGKVVSSIGSNKVKLTVDSLMNLKNKGSSLTDYFIPDSREFQSKVNNILQPYNGKQLTMLDKNKVVEELKKVRNATPIASRGNIMIPEKAEYIKKVENNNPIYDWKDEGLIPETKKMLDLKPDSIVYRIGNENGKTAALDKYQDPGYLSLPYDISRKNSDNDPSRHQYTIENVQISKESLIEKIKECDLLNDDQKKFNIDSVNDYYNTSKSFGGGDKGIKSGKTAPMFDKPGGADEVRFPLSFQVMEIIGMVTELF